MRRGSEPHSEPKDEPSGPTPSAQDHSANAPQPKPLKPAVSATNSVDIFTAKEGQEEGERKGFNGGAQSHSQGPVRVFAASRT